jgi:hypothetical protein
VFLKCLQQEAEHGRINFTKRFECFAWDMVSEMTYGERPGFIEAGMESFDILKAIRVKMDYVTLVCSHSLLLTTLFLNSVTLE